MPNHTPVSLLALYSRGDAGLWDRWRVARHLPTCDSCAQAVAEFTRAHDRLARAAEQLPPALTGAAWRSLASEMTANIRLGIAAGECVAPRSMRATSRPRLTLALAGITVLIVLLGLERPRLRTTVAVPPPRLLDASTTLEASGKGIGVRAAGNMLEVPAPVGRDVIRTVDTRGEIRSRYVDDTGVTVINVYAE